MTQSTDLTLSNQSGANYRTEHNSINQALGSTHKGGSAPSYAVTGMHWIDDNSSPWIEKVYDGTDWIPLYEINPTTNLITFINSADGDARTEVANIGQIQDNSFCHLSSVSGTNTITASTTPAITSYATGQHFTFVVGTTNTGAVTINIDSVGAKAVQKNGDALEAGDLVTGDIHVVVYDGTQFQLVSRGEEVATGAMVLLETQTASASASIEFTSLIDSTYKKYIIEVIDLIPVTDNTSLLLKISEDNGSTYIGVSIDTEYKVLTAGVVTAGSVTNQSSVIINNTFGVGNVSTEGMSATITLDNPSNTARYKTFPFVARIVKGVSDSCLAEGMGLYDGTVAAYNAVKLEMTGGNISSGTFKLYGVL